MDFRRHFVTSKKDGSACETLGISEDDERIVGVEREEGEQFREVNCSRLQMVQFGLNSDVKPVMLTAVDEYGVINKVKMDGSQEKGVLPILGESKFKRNNIIGSLSYRGTDNPPLMKIEGDKLDEVVGIFKYESSYLIKDVLYSTDEMDDIVKRIKLVREPGSYRHAFKLIFDLSEVTEEEKQDLRLFTKLPTEAEFVIEDWDRPSILIDRDIIVEYKIEKGRSQSSVQQAVYQVKYFPLPEITLAEDAKSLHINDLVYQRGDCQQGTGNNVLISMSAQPSPYSGKLKLELLIQPQEEQLLYESVPAKIFVGPPEMITQNTYFGTCDITLNEWDIEKSAQLSCKGFEPAASNALDLFNTPIDIDFFFTCDMQY